VNHDHGKAGPVPELLMIRWVCVICLKVIHARLEVSWKRELGPSGGNKRPWVPIAVQEPSCHEQPMLVLGEPKVDVHGLRGYGLIIDPLDTMQRKSAVA
jgi:hypothetical protein